jgi:2-oxoglutarate/2-oxoacid ferredoxin oxidoreductase subunit alpha
MSGYDIGIAIGGEAGQGIATPGDILARLFVRRGLNLNTYNAFQSIVRGGHIFLTMRMTEEMKYSHGDKIDLLLCLNQDTMDKHLHFIKAGGSVIYNSDNITPGPAADGVNLCGLPIAELTGSARAGLNQNTVAVGAILYMLGMEFQVLKDSLTQQFSRKGEAVVNENVKVAQAGYDYAIKNFTKYPEEIPMLDTPRGVWSGNEALAMGGAAAGVKFYAAYPMSPSTGVLHWFAANGRNIGAMVRQIEDEIGVANIVIGAAHTGVRTLSATSGGGFALMTEAIGAASMMEIPTVYIDVMRAGPSTGVPTKTEQGDLWQALGASQGDFQRFIVAPLHAQDAFDLMPEIFNLTDKYQVPGIVLSDLLISEGRYSVNPEELDFFPVIDRGETITEGANPSGEYNRYKFTDTGISPRAVAGLEGYVHVVATDEHEENSGLISDEFTNPHKRRAMVEKRSRKFENIEAQIAPPQVIGAADADVTLVGWGSTFAAMYDAIDLLAEQGITANFLSVKWLVPLHGKEITEIFAKAKRTIIVENNQSGQFARYLRGETGLTPDGHIRKYDGEPFMPHHIVDGVVENIKNSTEQFIPYQEIVV